MLKSYRRLVNKFLSLQQLHNLSVPNLEVVSTGFLRRTLRSDIFYKLFLAINGKVADRVGGMRVCGIFWAFLTSMEDTN